MSDRPPDFSRNPRLQQGMLSVVSADEVPFRLHPVQIKSGREIPHRRWLYGTHLIREFVTLLIAPGGTGKSSLMLAQCMSLALGRSLLGPRVYEQCNTALLNLEDPQDEMDRRVAALAERYGINQAEIDGKFFMLPPGRTITIATTAEDGFTVIHPDERAIIETVRENKIGFLGVDPFAESHLLEENSNPQMVQAAAAWRRVARLGGCAVALAHHVRKGQVDSIEAARGARALTDSARVGLLMSVMSEQEAMSYGLNPEDRLSYVRLDDAKMNLAARNGKATWFHLSHVELDNADAVYRRGDNVVVIEPWQPTSAFEGMTVDDCNLALDAIAAGPPGGGKYAPDRRREPWAGRVLMDQFGRTEAQAVEIITQWTRQGVVIREKYRDESTRKTPFGLSVVDARRPGTTIGKT